MRELLKRHLNFSKGALVCTTGNCRWADWCANHISATPIRRKEGLRPNIIFSLEGYFCDHQTLKETGAFYSENDI